jgi:NAD(P)-dependent dehydrogenase (short-subunit alcohol dehydrogenase family)
MSKQIVVVTGASGGTGRATAQAFGSRADTVVLVSRLTDKTRTGHDVFRHEGKDGVASTSRWPLGRLTQRAPTRSRREDC